MSKNNEEKKSVDDEKNSDKEQSPINEEIIEDETLDQSKIEEENNTDTVSELEQKVLDLKDQLMRSFSRWRKSKKKNS